MNYEILPQNLHNFGGFDLKAPQLRHRPTGPLGNIQAAPNSAEQYPQRCQTHMHSPAAMKQASIGDNSSKHNSRLQRIVRAIKNIKSVIPRFGKKRTPNNEMRHLRNADINKPLSPLPQNRSLESRSQNKPLPPLPQNRPFELGRQKVQRQSKVAPTPQEIFAKKENNNKEMLHKNIDSMLKIIDNATKKINSIKLKNYTNKSNVYLTLDSLQNKISDTSKTIDELNKLKPIFNQQLDIIYSNQKLNSNQLENKENTQLGIKANQLFKEIDITHTKLQSNINQMRSLEKSFQNSENFYNSNLKSHNHKRHAQSMHLISLHVSRLDHLLQENKPFQPNHKTTTIKQMLKINSGSIDYLNGHRDAPEVLNRFRALESTLTSLINKAAPDIKNDVSICAHAIIQKMNTIFQYTFSQKPFTFSREYNHYQARNGDKVIANAETDITKSYLQDFKNMIKEKSGIDPSNFHTSNPQEFRIKIAEISKIWLKEIVPLIEDQDRSNYGRARSSITKMQRKDPSMTVFLNSKSAVCRELSIIGSLLFSEYGIDTQVQSGTLKNQGGHAWLEIMDPNNKDNILAVLDSNYTRKLHPSKDDYMENMSYPTELQPQKIVKLNTAESIKFAI